MANLAIRPEGGPKGIRMYTRQVLFSLETTFISAPAEPIVDGGEA